MIEKGAIIFKSAKERYPDLFAITKFVIKKLHEWIDNASIPTPRTAVECVLHACTVRAYNLYRSINSLLETDHWEDAGILARSMFELVINLEEIQQEPGKEEEKARKYLRFNYLQQYLQTDATQQYNQKTSRGSASDSARHSHLQSIARSIFSEFVDPKRKSEWQKSWCGKSVHSLAKDSKDAMRYHHYKILYSFFSELSHSGPLPVMLNLIMGETKEEMKQLWEGHDDREKEYTALVLSLSTIWLLEVLMRGKDMIPDYDLKWNFEVMKMLYSCHDVEPPPFPFGKQNQNTSQMQIIKPQPIIKSEPDISRNSPCPCGSGKKYKKCCGKK